MLFKQFKKVCPLQFGNISPPLGRLLCNLHSGGMAQSPAPWADSPMAATTLPAQSWLGWGERPQAVLNKKLGISPPRLSLSSAIHVGLHITLFLKQRADVFKSPRSFGNQLQDLQAFLHTTYSQDSQDSSSCACVPKSSVTFSLASACINGEKISETISTLPSCHHSVSSPLPSY